MVRLLILGGTAEAVELAETCAALPLQTITSLAGRTRTPKLPAGRVRVGGFGGLDGLANYLRHDAIDLVIDATHPFAAQISSHAEEACRKVRLPRLRLLRPAWTAHSGDRWNEVESLADAAADLPEGDRVFLSVGRTELAAFAACKNWFLVRTIEPAEPAVDRPANVRWLHARGPFRLEDELALLRDHAIDLLVTKASGGEATYAKIAAARELGLPVIMIRRPPPPPGPVVDTVAAARAWLDHELAALAGRST